VSHYYVSAVAEGNRLQTVCLLLYLFKWVQFNWLIFERRLNESHVFGRILGSRGYERMNGKARDIFVAQVLIKLFDCCGNRLSSIRVKLEVALK